MPTSVTGGVSAVSFEARTKSNQVNCRSAHAPFCRLTARESLIVIRLVKLVKVIEIEIDLFSKPTGLQCQPDQVKQPFFRQTK